MGDATAEYSINHVIEVHGDKLLDEAKSQLQAFLAALGVEVQSDRIDGDFDMLLASAVGARGYSFERARANVRWSSFAIRGRTLRRITLPSMSSMPCAGYLVSNPRNDRQITSRITALLVQPVLEDETGTTIGRRFEPIVLAESVYRFTARF